MNIGSDKVEMNVPAPAPKMSQSNDSTSGNGNEGGNGGGGDLTMMDRILQVGGTAPNSSPTGKFASDDMQNKMNNNEDGEISAKLSPSGMNVSEGGTSADHLKKPPPQASEVDKTDIKKKSQVRKKWVSPYH